MAAGPDPQIDGVVRRRCADLSVLVKTRFGVEYHENSDGKLLRSLGFSHINALPLHPKQLRLLYILGFMNIPVGESSCHFPIGLQMSIMFA